MENITQNTKSELKKLLSADDIIFFDFKCTNFSGFLVYVDSITDRESLGELVLRPLNEYSTTFCAEEISNVILSANTEVCQKEDDYITKILSGKTALFIYGLNKVVLVDLKKFDSRAISEPPTSNVIKGPREGFTESIKTNLSLVRRRVISPHLKVEMLNVGKQSKTAVAFCYMANIANDSIINNIRKKINSISIDNIPDSAYLQKMLSVRKNSLFKQVGTTEKPDILVAKLMEGRVGIIVDGSPLCLTAPYILLEDFQNSEDYYKSTYKANMERVLRCLSLFIAVFLPGVFVAAQLFHMEFIPLKFLLTIVSSVRGIPLSPTYEMFFTLLIFEILNEASVRMPKYVGMALSIVGALVLGETAVQAGIVSSPAILIMALSGICLYTVPELVGTMSLIRFSILLVAGTLGGYGILVLSTFLFCYLSSMESFGIPYLSPYSPLVPQDLKDGILMDHLINMKKRPKSLKNSKNKVRM